MPLITNKSVGPLGYGCMGLSLPVDPIPDSQSFEALNTAFTSGCTFWNSADFYGRPPNLNANLQLLTRYFTAHPEAADKVVLSVKGGFDIINFCPRGDRTSIHASIDGIISTLDGKKFLDIFTPARVDKTVPIEETVAAVAEYVAAGKVGGIGLSEVSAATIRRAHKVHPISYVEVEVSLWSTDIFIPGGIADTCAELGIAIAAYSPLGRGFLTGEVRKLEDIPEDDMRRRFDRFQPGNFEKNIEIVHKVEEVARRKEVSMAQLALAWVLNKGNKEGKPVIMPIPSAKKRERVLENVGATELRLTDEEVRDLDEIVESVGVVGGRYNAKMEEMLLV